MSEASATYTLRWDGDFAAKAKESRAEADALAGSLKKIEDAGKNIGSKLKPPKLKPDLPNPKEAKSFAERIEPAQKALKGLGVDIGPFLDKGKAMGGVLGAGALAVAAAAVAVVALTAILIVAAAAFTLFAVKAADAARSANLLAQAATGSAAAGKALVYQAGQLAKVTALSDEKALDIGLSLARAGLEGKRLANVFETVAIASSTMGDAAGSKLASLAEQAQVTRSLILNRFNLQGTGVTIDEVATALAKKAKVAVSVAKAALQDGRVKVDAGLDALNEAVKNKLGKVAAMQAIGFTKQLELAKAAVTKLFAGVNLEPFLVGLKDVLSVLDQNTVTGKALASAMKAISQVLIGDLAKSAPFLKKFFQGMVIGALEFIVVVLQIRKWLKETFGGKLGGLDGMELALKAGKVAVYALIAGIMLVLAVIALVAPIFAAAFALVGGTIQRVITTVSWLVDAFTTARNYLASNDWSEIGKNLVDGLVNGIKSGVTRVVEAVKELGLSAGRALESALKIGSPSRVFMDYGMFTAQGFAEGVDAGTPEARRSVAEMVATPSTAAGAGSSGSSSPPVIRTIGHVEIHIHGVKDAQELREPNFFERLVMEFEKVVSESGAMLPAPEGTP